MTFEEFTNEFSRLANSFNVLNIEKKAQIYYQELKSLPFDRFQAVCRRLVRQEEHFPTISVILQMLDAMYPMIGQENIKQKCAHCDGYGWVMFENHAFRGRCEHGRKLSDRIAFAPETELDKLNEINRLQREIKQVYGGV